MCLVAQSLQFLMKFLGPSLRKRLSERRGVFKSNHLLHMLHSLSSWPLSLFSLTTFLHNSFLKTHHVSVESHPKTLSVPTLQFSVALKPCMTVIKIHFVKRYEWFVFVSLGLTTIYGNSWDEAWACFAPNVGKALPLPKGYLKCVKANNKFWCQFHLPWKQWKVMLSWVPGNDGVLRS